MAVCWIWVMCMACLAYMMYGISPFVSTFFISTDGELTDERSQRKGNLLQVLSDCYNYGSPKHMVAIRLRTKKWNKNKMERKREKEKPEKQLPSVPGTQKRSRGNEGQFHRRKNWHFARSSHRCRATPGPKQHVHRVLSACQLPRLFLVEHWSSGASHDPTVKEWTRTRTLYRAARSLKFLVRQTRDFFSILYLFNRSTGLCERTLWINVFFVLEYFRWSADLSISLGKVLPQLCAVCHSH